MPDKNDADVRVLLTQIHKLLVKMQVSLDALEKVAKAEHPEVFKSVPPPQRGPGHF